MSVASPTVAGPQPARWSAFLGRLFGYAAGVALGVLVGAVGTVAHRQWAPWVLILAFLMVGAAGVLVRAWHGAGALLPFGLGWLGIVQLLATTGPGGDVLLPGELISYVWIAGGMLMIAFAAFAPKKWFSA